MPPVLSKRGREPLVVAQSMARVRARRQYDEQIKHCESDFRYFVQYWKFTNRETGEIFDFSQLWPGQDDFADLMVKEPWIFALKAGKLGFTELECAYDGWTSLFRGPRTRVHIYSKDGESSSSILEIVKFGLKHLPKWLRPTILEDAAGGDTMKSLRFLVPWGSDEDDIRIIRSFNASKKVAIDMNAQHSHVDELSHMLFPKETWQAIISTVPQEGTVHIVTRGAGDLVYSAELYRAAKKGLNRLVAFFAPWTARPGRDQKWYDEQSGAMSTEGLLHFAPMTEEEALAGEDIQDYIPIDAWDMCWDEELPEIYPGTDEPCVLGLDAATTADCFAAVLVTRDPQKMENPAIRRVKIWKPEDFPNNRIDYLAVETWIRLLCQGGCVNGHPKSERNEEECEACRQNDMSIKPYNIVCLVYDPYQLENMSQKLTRDRVVWCEEFPQGMKRLVADRFLFDMVMKRRLVHNGDTLLRQHIGNAKAKLQLEEDSKMRIVKKAPDAKIDAAVASSMAVYQVMWLRLN